MFKKFIDRIIAAKDREDANAHVFYGTTFDENGNIIGGILGGTYWGWMYVDHLWVHESHRYKGIGSKLLREAEKEAICRGCHHVHLDTMSWQAPEFYQKHGYEVIGILPDIPNGNQKYLLMKALR